MFEECRLEGEFILSSGRQSGIFYDFDLLKPAESVDYAGQLVNNQIPSEVFDRIDFIAAPALGGIIPGFLVAFARGLPFVIVDKGGKPRGPQFQTGAYLIVDDVITSFKAAREVVNALPGMKCEGVAAYIFRGAYADLEKNKDIPAFYLARKEQEE